MGIKDFFTNGASKIVSDGTTNHAPPIEVDAGNSIEPASPHSSSDEKLDLEKDGAHVIDKQAVYGPDLKYDDGLVREVDELEKRLEDGDATKDEWRVEDSADIATKVLSTRDDPTLPVLTFRTFFLGLGFSAFGSVLAQIYYFKPQSISVSQGFLVILTYFFGHALALLPRRGWFRFLNPGPFNVKEHAALIIMCSTASGSATGIQVISVQNLYYDNPMNGAIAIFTLFSSQLLGYGYAGLLQDALVAPTIALWPQNISPAAMLQSLHFDGGLSLRRRKIFWIIFSVIFVYEILPQWIFPWLTGVSIICLVSHNSPVTRNIFGGANNNEGMGLLSWCFDWNLIGSACLYTPLWTQLNQDIGIILTYILMASVYYGNIWRGKDFPFMSQTIFMANGSTYPQDQILTNNVFDKAKYEAIGPAWFSATNALYLLVENLSLSATIVHCFLFYWAEIKPFFLSLNPWNKTKHFVHDPHYIKLQVYKQVPRWWYLCILVVAFAMAQATNYTGESGLPWWALIVFIIFAFFLCCFYATLAAILGFYQFSSGGTGFFQMLCSYFVPGKPVANMYAALYGATTMSQGINLLQDLKLGQYMKIPPRITFLMQMMGTLVGCILNYIMMVSIIDAQRPALLSVSGTRLWSGQNAQLFRGTSIAWGALGPQMFAWGSTYYMVPLSLFLGLFLPLPFYFLHRRRPKAGWNNLSTPVMLQYACFMSVGINTSVNPSMVIGIFSQYFVRRKFPKLFTKYNYIISSALDGGTQTISFLLNFAVFGAAGTAHNFPFWWGNPENLSVDRCMLPDS